MRTSVERALREVFEEQRAGEPHRAAVDDVTQRVLSGSAWPVCRDAARVR